MVGVVTYPDAEASSLSKTDLDHEPSSDSAMKYRASILFVHQQSSEHLDQIRYPCLALDHYGISIAL